MFHVFSRFSAGLHGPCAAASRWSGKKYIFSCDGWRRGEQCWSESCLWDDGLQRGAPYSPPPLLNYHFKPSSFILTPHYAMFGARSNATSGLGILYALSREKNQICLGRQHDRILPPKFDHKVNPVQTIKGLDNLRFSC